MAGNMKTSETTEFQWMRVREAIAERFPDVDRDGLADCPNDVGHLVNFVNAQVDANTDEVEEVIREFAPSDSYVDQITSGANEAANQAAESARFARMRADECIAERPAQSVLTSFVAGVAVGAMVTALWMRSQPQPSTWDRVKDRAWR